MIYIDPFQYPTFLVNFSNILNALKYLKFGLILTSLTKREYTLKAGHKTCYTISGNR